MQGSFSHQANHYRCRFPVDRGTVPGFDHPRSVYVRENRIVPKLDEWIGTLFDPANLDETCEATTGGATEADHARIEAARREIAVCDQRLANYRAALDAGADARLVDGWMTEVQGERLAAERKIGLAQPTGQLTREQVRKLVMSHLRPGTPGGMDRVTAGESPGAKVSVGAPSRAKPDWRLQPWDLGK